MFTVTKLMSGGILSSGLTMGCFKASGTALYVGSLHIATVTTYLDKGQKFCTDHF